MGRQRDCPASTRRRVDPYSPGERAHRLHPRRRRTEDLLPRITADTLVIHGRQDRVVPEEEVEFLADGIAGAALALIEEAGHCSPIEQPQAFTAVMRLWLTR